MEFNILINGNMNIMEKIMVLINWILICSLVGYILTMNGFYIYMGCITIIFIIAGSLYSNISGVNNMYSALNIPTPNPTSVFGSGSGSGSGQMIEGFKADNNIYMEPHPYKELEDENLYLETSQSNPNPSTIEAPHLINVATGKSGRNAVKSGIIKNPVTLEEVLETDYYPKKWQNPFGNMLLPEIKYDTDRKSAPPSFNVDVSEDITKNVKKAVQQLNPTIKNTNKQLFGDLYNNFMLDNSNRVFYSMPSTRIEDDQNAFANFLYHDLIYSGKESTVEGAMARIQDNQRYIMY